MPDDAPTTGAPLREDASQGAALFQLVTRPRPTPHIWGAQRIVAAPDSPSGHEQREWSCQRCHLVRITVMPAGQDARREWRFAGGCQFQDLFAPECVLAIDGAPQT